MIPKRLHYCWFGEGPLPTSFSVIERSWRRYLIGWEFVRWDETKLNRSMHPFFAAALDARKFAFASDYARVWVLHEFGGVYLDTDVELKGSLDRFLHHRAFTGFETVGFPVTAVWGSEAGHPLLKQALKHYDESPEDFTTPNTEIIGRIVSKRFGIDPAADVRQSGSHGLEVYPSTMFCLDLPENVAAHHFEGSWVGQRDVAYKEVVHAKWYVRQAIESPTKSRSLLEFTLVYALKGLKQYGFSTLALATSRVILRLVSSRVRRLCHAFTRR